MLGINRKFSVRKIGRELAGKRMIHRYYEEVFQRMPPERRARKLAVMKALAKTLKNKNKENEDPLNNNMVLACGLIHSTPVKNEQITDLDDQESESKTETDMKESELCDGEEPDETHWGEEEETKLVISKIYDLTDIYEADSDDSSECGKKSAEADRTDLQVTEFGETIDKNWSSLEVLHEAAEYEFCRSLEESKLFVSSSSLLEEIEADLPLAYSLAKPLNHTFHTLNSYRSQVRLARMEKNQTIPETVKEKESLKTSFSIPSRRIDFLEMEAKVQKALAEQAEKALVLSKSKKFFGVEHIESEKAFLLTNLRHNAAVQETKKLRILGGVPETKNIGQVTLSDISFEVIESTNNYPEKYICTASERERVQSTSVVSEVTNGKLQFNESLKFSNLSKDFVIYIDLFKLQFKELKRSLLKPNLVRKLKMMTAVNLNRSLTSSSYSKGGFACVAQCELRLENIEGREDDKCVLQNDLTVGQQCRIIGGSVNLLVKTDINLQLKKSGFLNVFKQTWHGRWFLQTGYFLESWIYPEDQDSDKAPADSVYLPNCSSVEPVGFETCVRPHSFAIKLKENKEEILFSANSHKDMLSWVDHLNSMLELIRLWKPKT